MAVLLLAEVTDGALALDATAKAVTAAAKLGDVTVLAAGASAAAAGEEAAKIAGVAKVLVAEDASLGHRLAEPTAALIASLASDYEHIVAPATTDAKNVLPRVAALLDVMVISDVSGVVDGNTFERPIYAGNAVQTVKSNDAKRSSPSGPPPLTRLATVALHLWKPSLLLKTPACPSGLRTRLPRAIVLS